MEKNNISKVTLLSWLPFLPQFPIWFLYSMLFPFFLCQIGRSEAGWRGEEHHAARIGVLFKDTRSDFCAFCCEEHGTWGFLGSKKVDSSVRNKGIVFGFHQSYIVLFVVKTSLRCFSFCIDATGQKRWHRERWKWVLWAHHFPQLIAMLKRKMLSKVVFFYFRQTRFCIFYLGMGRVTHGTFFFTIGGGTVSHGLHHVNQAGNFHILIESHLKSFCWLNQHSCWWTASSFARTPPRPCKQILRLLINDVPASIGIFFCSIFCSHKSTLLSLSRLVWSYWLCRLPM